MYSINNYNVVNSPSEHLANMAACLSICLKKYKLQALLLIQVDSQNKEYSIIAGENIPIEPFNGAEKHYIDDVLKDCFGRHSKPHIHNIKQFALPSRLRKFNIDITGANRIWFLPIRVIDSCFIFLGFPPLDSSDKAIPSELCDSISAALLTYVFADKLTKTEKRLSTTELCSKEIGHDISSSVQAVLAKARTITQRRVEGDAIQRRAREIEFEIMAIYRHSESLGIAVDRDYQVKEWDDFDAIDVVNNVCDSFRSEAEERGITIDLSVKSKTILLFGDQRAVENALGQIVLNAIKYAYGKSIININIVDEGDYARFEVVNVGIPLPETEKERQKLWEFGARSKAAKELHVNGSGIGLYTCRKIILAHIGMVFCDNPKVVIFGFRIPTKKWLRRNHGEEFILEKTAS